MRRIDRLLGLALALLAGAVLWSSRAFPAVPGQKVGAGFLPTLVGAGLLLCGLGLAWRSWRGTGYADEAVGAGGRARDERERLGPAAVVVAVVVGFIVFADRLGFLIVAPVGLWAVFVVLRVKPLPALALAVAGTVVVHLVFYKLLRVPLPWGLLSPLY